MTENDISSDIQFTTTLLFCEKTKGGGLKINKNPKKAFNTTMCVRPSTVENAGKGVFATEDIPSFFCCDYKGVFVEYEIDPHKCQTMSFDPEDATYTWTINGHVSNDGMLEMDDSVLECTWFDKIGHCDAKSVEHWTKYVNSAKTEEAANIGTFQLYDTCDYDDSQKIFYFTKRKIHRGEELFVFYGKECLKQRGLLKEDS